MKARKVPQGDCVLASSSARPRALKLVASRERAFEYWVMPGTRPKPAGNPDPGEGRMEGRRAIAVEAGAANAVVGAKAAELAEHQAADPQTGLGAGDVEEAGAIGIADADIFDGRRLGGRQIGGAGTRRQNGYGQARGRTQKKSFEQCHVKSPSREPTLGPFQARADGGSILAFQHGEMV